ncbi:MAG: hypothetical protein ACETVN_00170, partial [Asgard group archaeon]
MEYLLFGAPEELSEIRETAKYKFHKLKNRKTQQVSDLKYTLFKLVTKTNLTEKLQKNLIK